MASSLRHGGKLAKALDDEVNWGSEFAQLRRLSGLASDAEHRERARAKRQSALGV